MIELTFKIMTMRQDPIKVLVVEAPAKDTQQIRQILSGKKDPSYSVESETNQRVALERVLKSDIHVVLMDESALRSPGSQVIDHWADKSSSTPIIIIADGENQEYVQKAIEKGAQDFLLRSDIDERILPRVIKYAMERKVSEERTRSLANRGLAFVSLVSHELRAPLAIVKEGVNLVLDKILGKTNQKQHQVLTATRRNINRLDQIITNMLDISKIEAGDIRLQKQWFDLVDVVKKVIGSYDLQIREKKLNLRVTFSGQTVEVYADKYRIFQILSNLIGNAIKFSEKGTITIAAFEKSGHIECSISDNGVGIAKDDLAKVFCKFQPFGWTPGGGEKGMGLGLAISKSLVELHSGTIQVESQLGKGSCFTFSLPKEPTSKFGRV